MIPQELKNNQIFKKALKYCTSNIKCESEVLDKLRKLEASNEDIDLILKTLISLKFCFSDKDYVTRFLENLSSIKGHSKIQIKTKLLRKGISSKVIDPLLKEYYKVNEESEVIKYIGKNLSKLSRKAKEKRLGFVVSKGFSVDLSKKILTKFDL